MALDKRTMVGMVAQLHLQSHTSFSMLPPASGSSDSATVFMSAVLRSARPSASHL
jgi:hypothetical protein